MPLDNLTSHSMLFRDESFKSYCYRHGDQGLTDIRMKVCRKFKSVLQSKLQARELQVSILAVKLENAVHTGYYYSEILYRKTVVKLVKRLEVILS